MIEIVKCSSLHSNKLYITRHRSSVLSYHPSGFGLFGTAEVLSVNSYNYNLVIVVYIGQFFTLELLLI